MAFLFRPNSQFGAVLAGGRGAQQFVKHCAERVADKAREDFLRQVKHTGAITPPPYADSFFVREKAGTTRYMVGNSDPAAVMVEFGAHPRGGATFVLAYHPLVHGIEAAHNAF